MHQWQDYEQGVARETISMLEGNQRRTILLFSATTLKSSKEAGSKYRKPGFAFSYPRGEYNTLAAVLLNEQV